MRRFNSFKDLPLPLATRLNRLDELARTKFRELRHVKTEKGNTWSPQFTSSFDLISVLYHALDHFKPKSFLDAGCSVGMCLTVAEFLKIKATGIELNKEAVVIGKRRKLNIVHGFIQDYKNFADHDFVYQYSPQHGTFELEQFTINAMSIGTLFYPSGEWLHKEYNEPEKLGLEWVGCFDWCGKFQKTERERSNNIYRKVRHVSV